MPTNNLTDELRERRVTARTAADEIITRAADEARDLTGDELAAYTERVTEQRDIGDRLEQLADEQVRELRAATARTAGTDEPNALGQWLTRAITSASGAGAAFTPAEYPSQFFDRLSATSVGLRSGFAVVSTTRDSVVIPRITADPTAAWTAEGAAITASDLVADTITATPRKLAALQQVSNEALADSNPSLMERIGATLVRAMALKMDLGFFEGSGTPPEIRGLKNVSGISTVSMGANGLSPVNLDAFADALGTLAEANSAGSVIVMHPRTWRSLSKIKEITGSVKPVLNANGSPSNAPTLSIYGVPVYLSSQLSITETQGSSSNASSAYIYDPEQVVVVRREDISVEVDHSRLFNSDQSEIRAIARLDLVVPNPAAVVRIIGLLP